jgi:ADP-heptose:LPS heptosyltransferase
MVALSYMRWLDTWVGGTLVCMLGWWPRRPHAVPPAPREIVIVKLMGLGSLLTCAGVWRALRQCQPQARIVVVSLAGTAAVARLLPEVDEVLAISTTNFWQMGGDGWRVWRALRRRRVDVIVDIEYFSHLCAIFCALTGARYRLGFLRHQAGRAGPPDPPPHAGQAVGGRAGPPDPPSHHAGRLARGRWLDGGVVLRDDQHFRTNVAQLLQPLGVVEGPLPRVTVALPAEALQEAEKLLAAGAPPVTSWIVVNPHASELCWQRRWPLERFAQVVAALLAGDLTLGVVLPGTADERSRAEALRELLLPAARARVRVLAGQTTLAVLAGVLRQSRLVLTGDTGVMHLAAAVGAPLVALFGPESPVRYGPAGDSRRTLVLTGEVPCGPCLCCENRKQAPCTAEPAACMLAIPVATVQHACEQLLSGCAAQRVP